MEKFNNSIHLEQLDKHFESTKYVSIPPVFDTESGKYILYHGSKQRNIDSFITPTQREEMDVTKGGVVYLTSDIDKATKYAGKDGVVYEILVSNPISYHEQREKQGLPEKSSTFLQNVFVTIPGEIEIKRTIDSQYLQKPTRKQRKEIRHKLN